MGILKDWREFRAARKTESKEFTALEAEKERAQTQTEQSNFIKVQLGVENGFGPSFTLMPDQEIEFNEAAASCIQTNATYCSKAEFSSVRILKDGERDHDNPKLDRLLQVSPNPTQAAAVFWERVAYFYWKYNNSIIYIEKNPFGEIVALWSIDPTRIEFAKISTGEMLFRFTINGKQYEAVESELILIPRMVVRDPMFGKQTEASIKRVIKLINTNYDGIENAILTSSFIRFIIERTTKMSDERLREDAEKFTADYLKPTRAKPIGAIFGDATMKITPLNQSQQKTATYPEVNQWNKAVYKYYGCPEEVIEGTADENKMTSYYERTLEPLFIRAAQEMTRKIFTIREYEVGNRIIFSNRSFAYLSMKTRLELFSAAREIGAFTLGTLGDILGLPVPRGKRSVVVTSQNYNDSLQEQEKSLEKDSPEEGAEEEEITNKSGEKGNAGDE